jgi:hypothetical protein
MTTIPHLHRVPRWRTIPQTRARETRAGGVTAKDALVHRTLAKVGILTTTLEPVRPICQTSL